MPFGSLRKDPGEGPAPFAPSLLRNLIAGDYTLTVSGTIFGANANYDLKVGVNVVPIPGAILLLASGLAGLGALTYRCRKAA